MSQSVKIKSIKFNFKNPYDLEVTEGRNYNFKARYVDIGNANNNEDIRVVYYPYLNFDYKGRLEINDTNENLIFSGIQLTDERYVHACNGNASCTLEFTESVNDRGIDISIKGDYSLWS